MPTTDLAVSRGSGPMTTVRSDAVCSRWHTASYADGRMLRGAEQHDDGPLLRTGDIDRDGETVDGDHRRRHLATLQPVPVGGRFFSGLDPPVSRLQRARPVCRSMVQKRLRQRRFDRDRSDSVSGKRFRTPPSLPTFSNEMKTLFFAPAEVHRLLVHQRVGARRRQFGGGDRDAWRRRVEERLEAERTGRRSAASSSRSRCHVSTVITMRAPS